MSVGAHCVAAAFVYGKSVTPLCFSTTMMRSVKASEDLAHMAMHMPLPPMICGHFIAPTQVSGSLLAHHISQANHIIDIELWTIVEPQLGCDVMYVWMPWVHLMHCCVGANVC